MIPSPKKRAAAPPATLVLPVFAGSGFLRAYSGTLYLLKALQARGIEPWVAVDDDPAMAPEYAGLPFRCELLPRRTNLHSLPQLLRNRLFRLHVLFRAAMRSRALLVTESRFIREAALYKKLRPSGTLIHFCQELYLPRESLNPEEARLYARFAGAPDIVIDVEPTRARLRQEQFHLKSPPWVLLNTLPEKAMPPPAPPGTLAALAGTTLPSDRPVLLVTGGTGAEKPLTRVIDAVALADRPVFLLAFCTGDRARLEELNTYAAQRLGAGRHFIRGPVRRDLLLACMGEADMACVDYSTSVQDSSNQRYCAPTKLFEFMAAGLAVVGSENESLRSIVEGEQIGICAADGRVQSLAAAIAALARDASLLRNARERGPVVFREKYSYERCCEPVVAQLAGVLKSGVARESPHGPIFS